MISIGRKVVSQEQVFYLQGIYVSLQGLLNTSPLLCDDFEISCYLSIGRFLIPINFFYISFNKLLINNRKVKRYKEEGIERDNILYIGLSLYRGKSCLCFPYSKCCMCVSYIYGNYLSIGRQYIILFYRKLYLYREFWILILYEMVFLRHF